MWLNLSSFINKLLFGLSAWYVVALLDLRQFLLCLTVGSAHVLVARNTHSFCIQSSIGVSAGGRENPSTVAVVTLVAHALCVVLAVRVGAINHLLVLLFFDRGGHLIPLRMCVQKLKQIYGFCVRCHLQ